MATPHIANIIKRAGEASTREQKAQILAEDQTGTVATILRVALDPSIVLDLPEGVPPYKENDLVDQEGVIYREVRKFKNFVKGIGNVAPIRRQALFVEMLEMLDAEDAKVVATAKEKQSLGKGITVHVANKAFPGLINEKK